MSDGPVKAEFADRIDRLEELADAEREVQGLKTRFEQAQHEVVRSAEQLLEWQQLLGERRRAVIARYPDAVPVDKVLIDAQATIDRFCDEVRANNERFSIREPESRDHLIDAQTTDPVDPRVECASDEPEIPEGFTKWEGGEWTGLPTDRVQVIFCDEPTPYFPTEAENLDPLWCWDRCPPDAQRIIAYRIVEAPAPEQDASVETQYDKPIPDDIVRLPEIVTDLWQQGYDDKAKGYEPSLAEPEYTKGYEARALIEREHRETMERARFFDGGMMADADRHQSDQRGIVGVLTGMFKSKVDA